jgi:hypothetical protein
MSKIRGSQDKNSLFPILVNVFNLLCLFPWIYIKELVSRDHHHLAHLYCCSTGTL